MNTTKKVLATALSAIALVGGLSACKSDADVVSHNLSKDADNFKVLRRVVVYNNFTDQYISETTGFCSRGNNDKPGQVTVTCKVAEGDDAGSYIKNIYFPADNTTIELEQLNGLKVSPHFYKVVLKPSTIIPAPEIR